MNMKNRGGREARKPKAAKNTKGKGQTPTQAGPPAAGSAASSAVGKATGHR